jgi:hypothetical protein
MIPILWERQTDAPQRVHSLLPQRCQDDESGTPSTLNLGSEED